MPSSPAKWGFSSLSAISSAITWTLPARLVRRVGFPAVALSNDQKAMLRLLAQREQGYDDIGALMGIGVDEVRAKVKAALDGLDGGLSQDQKAILRMQAQREEGYGDIGALMGIGVDEVRAKVKDAVAGLDQGPAVEARAPEPAPAPPPKPDPEPPAPAAVPSPPKPSAEPPAPAKPRPPAPSSSVPKKKAAAPTLKLPEDRRAPGAGCGSGGARRHRRPAGHRGAGRQRRFRIGRSDDDRRRNDGERRIRHPYGKRQAADPGAARGRRRQWPRPGAFRALGQNGDHAAQRQRPTAVAQRSPTPSPWSARRLNGCRWSRPRRKTG